jgi:cytidylate kinase
MTSRKRSIEQIIEEQVKKWQMARLEKKDKTQPEMSVITISREPGSGGRIIAKELGEKLGLDVFHQEMIHEIAESAHVGRQLVEILDEKGLSLLEDWVHSLVNERHLWPDRYMKHLMKVVGTIGRHGEAVMVGRGANFILPPERRLSVRVIAPRKSRVRNVAETFELSTEEAERRVARTEANRKAFVRKYFYTDIADPLHYDLIINTGNTRIETAVKAICSAYAQQRV